MTENDRETTGKTSPPARGRGMDSSEIPRFSPRFSVTFRENYV